MAEPIKPVAKAIYVCDDVVSDAQSGKVSVLNLWDAVLVPAGASFPYCLARLCVFAWLRDGFGKVKTRIDIVQASSGNVVRRTNDCVIEFEARATSMFTRYKLENCIFSKPGYYFIELYCQNDFVDDQVIRVYSRERR
jgi:hypothetical protein